MSDTSPHSSTQRGADSIDDEADCTHTEPYTVSSFTFSTCDTDSSLTVRFCGLRMYVNIFAANLQKSAKRLNGYLHFLKVADAYEPDGLTVEDFYDCVLEGCSSTFAQIVQPTLPTTPTLADYLYPVTRCYSLHANGLDELTLVETTKTPSKWVGPETRALEESCHSWPSFTPSLRR